MGKSAGYAEKIVVEPEEGYGEVNENLFEEIPRSQFPDDCDIEPGMNFHAEGPHGPIMLTVKEALDDKVIVDLNHPLAGMQLHFDVKIVEVRQPTAEELASLEQQSGGCGCGCGEQEQTDCGSGCGSGCGCG